MKYKLLSVVFVGLLLSLMVSSAWGTLMRIPHGLVDHFPVALKGLVVARDTEPAASHFAGEMKKFHMPFLANEGQVESQVRFYARTLGGTVFVTEEGKIVYSLPKIKGGETVGGVALEEELVGGAIGEIKAEGRVKTNVSYFKGDDPSKWRSNVSAYDSINVGEVYQGINLKLKAYGNNVEKLFFVQPGAKPEAIKLRLSGAQDLRINETGELEVETELGVIAFTRPVAYQEVEGHKQYVEVAYTVEEDQYGFTVGEYDRKAALIIDPLLASTLLGGGSVDWGNPIAVDRNGDVYVTGYTSSTDFPTTPGAYSRNHIGNEDIFISKLDGGLTTLLASTFLGGGDNETVRSISVDRVGNVYVTGSTSSSDFPTTPGAYDKGYNGISDVFVSKLDSDLTALLASTFLGGGEIEIGHTVTVDGNGAIYVAGRAGSHDFPTTANAYDRSFNGGNYDVFVSKLDGDLTTLLASTLFGGEYTDVAVSVAIYEGGTIYVAGYTGSSDFPLTPGAYDQSYNGDDWDAFVSKLDGDLTTLLASTFLGGSRHDVGRSIALGENGNVYVAGDTSSSDFPTTSGAYSEDRAGDGDIFVSKLDSGLTTLLASTFLGGSRHDREQVHISMDRRGNIYVVGNTLSSDFPIAPGAYDETHNGNRDAFVSKLNGGLTTLLASTFLGGGGDDWGYSITTDVSGNVYVTGYTESSDFPTTVDAYDEEYNGSGDVFVSRLDSQLSSAQVNPPPDFGLVLFPASQTVYPGTVVTYSVAVTASFTFAGPVTMTLKGLPIGVEGIFSSNPANPNSIIDLRLTAAPYISPGTYRLAITGSATILSGTIPVPLTRTAQVTLVVLPSAITPTVSPGLQTVYQSQHALYTITISATPGLTQPAKLGVEGLADAEVTLWPDLVPLDGMATLCVTTTLDTAPGTRIFTVTASNRNLTRTTQARLNVLPAALMLSVAPSSRTVYQEQSATYVLTVEATPGFSQPIALAADNLDGLAYSLAPNPVSPGESATLVLTTTLSSLSKSRVFTVTASSGGLSSAAQAELIVLLAGIMPSVSPASRTVYQGQFTTYAVTVRGTPGLTGSVLMSVDGLDDTAFGLRPNPLPLGGTATLAVTTTLGTAPGTRSPAVTAMTGKLISAAHASLTVLPANITPTVSPALRTVYRGQSTYYAINLSATPGLGRSVALEAGPLPESILHTFAPSAVAPGGSANLIITATESALLGTYQFTITGVVGSLAWPARATLEVKVAVYLPVVFKRWPPIPYQPTLSAIQGADDGNYTVSWTESPMRLADTYTLQEATEAAFTTGLREVCTTTQQSCAVSDKLAGAYYYRVRGHNSWGDGAWSDVQVVTVLLPEMPTIEAIDNTDGDGSYVVRWNVTARAASYTLQEDTDPSFGNPTVAFDGAQAFWTVEGKVAGIYYYRVLATGPTGQSPWSTVQSVTVLPPGAPRLNPIDNADGDGYYVITWDAAARATAYTLEEATDQAFGNPKTLYNGADRSWSVAGQSYGTYYYRVKATGPTGQSNWSNTESAAVPSPPPGVNVLNNYTTYTRGSYRYVVGEVYNNTSSSLFLVKVPVNFFNGDQLVETSYSFTPLWHLHPYEKSCFEISLNEPAAWTHYTFEPPSYWTISTRRPNITVVSHSGGVYSTSYYRVLGQVRNDETVEVSSASVVATLYNAIGKVVGCDSSYVNSTRLAPGQVSSFEVQTALLDPSSVASYALQTDGSK